MMSERRMTCIECPVGCEMSVKVEDGKAVFIQGNACPRGKRYAEQEAVCPMRIVTSTVRAENGTLIPVKTSRAIKKENIFPVMEKINRVRCKLPVKIGQILYENISDGADLIVTGESE